MSKQKLELTWIGKNNQPKLEPRILIEEPDKSYGDKNSENMLIHGDNLLALKALEQDYAGKIKCIYIDPPYNTGNAFEYYEDGLEHSLWLSLMKPRLELLRNLLRHNGSIWVSIDDNESHYLKVLMDETFGRGNFVSSVVWQKRTSPDARATIGAAHDSILIYAKSLQFFKSAVNFLPLNEKQKKQYKNPDDDPRGTWVSTDFTGQTGHATPSQFYTIIAPNGKKHPPPSGRCWALAERTFYALVKDGRVWFGKDGNGRPRLKRYLSDSKGQVAWTWWTNDEVGHNQEAKKEILAINSTNIFDTPKPERLIQRIIHLATNEGDIVLDSFLGSGTTSAVAHKMNRKWIGVELGEHCETHCLPRLKKVLNGEDQGGISKTVNWEGGGGFKYYRLAPSLLNQDQYYNWVISKDYNSQMLAAAMAKQEGFKYHPDENYYWKQGQSTEKDFIFTTTQLVTVELIDKLHEDMQDDESLLICCKSFQNACDSRYDNITVKKIPNMLLGRCEFGKEEYSLNIVNIPVEEEEMEDIPLEEEPEETNGGESKPSQQMKLFSTLDK